jgi:predicted GIY-YIG superfamily endonuclease
VWFVYILANEADAEHFYVGLTKDVHARLVAHNAGQVRHTKKFRPWRLKTYVAFSLTRIAPLPSSCI